MFLARVPTTMTCERCGSREATEHLSRITETSITVAELCRPCYIVASGPVDIEEVAAWLKLESEMGAGFDWTNVAREWLDRMTLYQQVLPAEIAAFIERGARGSSG